MTKKERFNAAYDYLMFKHAITRQEDLAKMMGSTQSNISGALRGVNRILTDKFLRRFHACFENIFSLEWLLDEKGEMLIKQHPTSEQMPKPKSATAESRIIELYSSVISTYEERIRELTAALAETRQLREDLNRAIAALNSLHGTPYPEVQAPMFLAAEPQPSVSPSKSKTSKNQKVKH